MGPYIMQNVLILIAPALMAASIYMILGRIILLTEGEHHALIRRRWLTKIFVFGDVASLLLQSSGGGLMAVNEDLQKIGQNVIIGGLFVQLLFFGCFIYGKNGLAFIAPAPISRPPDVILPRSQIPWMMDQPDRVLSAVKAHDQILYTEYNFLGKDLAEEPFASRVVHKYLARHLPSLIQPIEEEVNAAVQDSVKGTHHDEDIYEGAMRYDPWRYSRVREAWEAKSEGERKDEEGVKARGLGMVTTSDAHLAFGHGRHACPGRFFVAHELKLIMAALLLNYDIKMIDQRPKPQWLGATIIPPLDACIEIRRKTKS
ncbi:hypothetical protein CEP52_004805 [Fusarium oligoseptatum]|uniref:Cytochrome P450 n=1 Tax=Fusarium oligoseptatum TaxID=2604345 RepID=A0A428U1M5_9HYPO|nr:hypothetical protein CEP52_004805 [Fusarium oligoseptatum]